MFLRKREIRNTFYWSIEETYREGKEIKKRLIKYLGKTNEAYNYLKNVAEYKIFFNEINSFIELQESNRENLLNNIFCMDHTKQNQGVKILPYNYLDSIVTDPPYEIKFMGKEWDNTGIAFRPAFWKECYNALKPGGYLLSFSGTRTYHKMAYAIEKAGFEIRDKIDVFYNGDTDLQNFLQSLSEEQLQAYIRLIEQQGNGGFISWLYGSGFPKSMDISKAIDKSLGAERKVVGYYNTHDIRSNGYMDKKGMLSVAITEASSKLAKQWEGWGTALKPANEPIVVARKPLNEISIVSNIVKWGTSGINIDGCRVKSPEGKGRFPANVILGDSAVAKVLDDQSGVLKSGSDNIRRREGSFIEHGGLGKPGDIQISYGDTGGASRFFYCAKASQSEREPYNTHPTVKPLKLIKYLIRMVTPAGGISCDPFLGSGTHSVACIELSKEGYPVNYIGFEKDRKSYKIAQRRIKDSI